MSDRFVYRCRECQVATVASHHPVEHDCPVCGAHDWNQEAQIS